MFWQARIATTASPPPQPRTEYAYTYCPQSAFEGCQKPNRPTQQNSRTAPVAHGAATAQPGPSTAPLAEEAAPRAGPADPWAAILEAGAALLQGLAAARTAGGANGDANAGAAPITIERDPVTGQASVRLPLPDAAVLQRLAKAFEPWLR